MKSRITCTLMWCGARMQSHLMLLTVLSGLPGLVRASWPLPPLLANADGVPSELKKSSASGLSVIGRATNELGTRRRREYFRNHCF